MIGGVAYGAGRVKRRNDRPRVPVQAMHVVRACFRVIAAA
jgi:hypothetical protein